MKSILIHAGHFIGSFGDSRERFIKLLYQENPEYEIRREIADFQAGNYLSQPEVRTFERAAQLLSVAAAKTIEEVNYQGSKLEPWEIGISAGNVYGSITSLSSVASKIVEKGLKGIRPKEGVNCILCGPVSKVAILYQIKGQNIVNTNGMTASLDALIYAADEINAGRIRYMLAGGMEEYSPLLKIYNRGISDISYSEGAGTVMVSLEEGKISGDGVYLAGMGKYFTPDGDYVKAMVRAMEKAQSQTESKIDLVLCGFNQDEQTDRARKQAVAQHFAAIRMPCYSSKWLFGETSGADGIFSVITALEVLKHKKLPRGCIYQRDWKATASQEETPVNTIMIVDFDLAGQASCVILRNGEK